MDGSKRKHHVQEVIRQWLVDVMERHELNASQLAKLVGCQHTTISRPLQPSADYIMSYATIYDIQMALGEDPPAVIGRSRDIVRAPYFRWESLRQSHVTISDLVPSRYIPIADAKRGRSLIATNAGSDDLSAVIPRGSTVLVDTGDRDLESGRLYMVVRDADLRLLRYAEAPDRLESVNIAGPSTVITDIAAVQIAGRIVESRHTH